MKFVELPTETDETITINVNYLVLLVPGTSSTFHGTWMHFVDGSKWFTTVSCDAIRMLAG